MKRHFHYFRCGIAFLTWLWAAAAHGQSINSAHTGIYARTFGFAAVPDTASSLKLSPNGRFRLVEDYGRRVSTGDWTSRHDSVILNPSLGRETVRVTMREEYRGDADSITIRLTRYSDTDVAKPLDFRMATVCLGKRRRYSHLVEKYIPDAPCAFAPRIRKQVTMRKDGTFRIARRDFRRIGFLSYDFRDVVWLDVSDPKSDFFDVTFIESDPTARRRVVRMHPQKAWIQEKGNQVPKRFEPLWRKE